MPELFKAHLDSLSLNQKIWHDSDHRKVPVCITPSSTGKDLPSPSAAPASPALSPFQLGSPTDHFSNAITCCYHGGSCYGKTELSDPHPMAPNLRQNVEGSHSVTTGLSGVFWVPTQTELLGHNVVRMEVLWPRLKNPREGGAEAGHPVCDVNNSCLASPHHQPQPRPKWTLLPTSSGSLQPLVSHN